MAVTKEQLLAPAARARSGWTGLGEKYLGAWHLGVFAQYIPREVETSWGLGGWGFGHQTSGQTMGLEQGYCWEGRIIPPTTFEISVGRVGPTAGTVVFRSYDPTIWNQTIDESVDHWAKELTRVHHPISYVSILRTDTGQSVVIPADRVSVTGRSDHPELGWNGLNDRFYGTHHLGVYHPSAEQDVQVAFGRGGWGFGHPIRPDGEQAFAWAGRSIGKTVFEIAVYDQLPRYLRRELLDF